MAQIQLVQNLQEKFAQIQKPMYYRKKRGKGFSYTDQEGKTIRDAAILEWIKSLVIPPAWKEVEISANKRNKILATGRDDKGRKQYIYNPRFRQKQEAQKFDRIIEFADQLEHMRRVTGQHLRKKKPTREKVMAAMVRLLESAFFRPGNDAYAQENQSYGLTTMRSRHLSIEGDKMIFSYKGKSGKEQEKEIVDGKLARIVKELDELPGYEIFKYLDEDGTLVDVKSDDLNAYIREHMGEQFSAKDFRTWSGTMIAAIALDELGADQAAEQKQMDKNIRAAVIRVSEMLGNTPAVARGSYIDRRIIDNYLDGKTLRYFEKEITKLLKEDGNLSRDEIGVLFMLKQRLAQK